MTDRQEVVAKLHLAIEAEDVKAVTEQLSSAGNTAVSTLDTVSENGFTAVYLACMRKCKLPMLQAILKYGPSMDAKGDDKETPIYIAAHNGLTSHISLLLAAGANVNELNGVDSETALHSCCRFGYSECCDTLIKGGANMNMRNVRMETPLFVASKYGKHEVVFQLLQLDANKNLANEDGKNPLFIASEKGQKHVVHILKVDKQHLRDAKAQADVELKMLAPALPTTEQLVDRARKQAEEDRENEKKGIKKKPTEKPKEEVKAAQITKIDIPEDVQRTHDPLTGKAYGPCKTLDQVPRTNAPEIPKGMKLKPVKHENIGGTSMKVGSGTGLKIKEKAMISQIPDSDLIDYGNAAVAHSHGGISLGNKK